MTGCIVPYSKTCGDGIFSPRAVACGCSLGRACRRPWDGQPCASPLYASLTYRTALAAIGLRLPSAVTERTKS